MAKKSRTREARQRRQKEQQKNQQRVIIAVIVVIAVLVGALLFVSNQPAEIFIPDDLTERYDGLQRSTSVEGYPRLGDPDAPVTVEEYSSFSCPGCEAFHSASVSPIIDRVRTGQVLFTYIPLDTGSIPNAQGAATTALCAGQQGQFWEMHDLLFDWHTRYVNTAFSQTRLLTGVGALGMNTDSFNSCFFSQSIADTLANAQNEGVASTPTVDVNGVTVVSQDGGIPSTEEVLQAIDNATPSDWSPNAVDENEEVTEDEDTVEPEVTAAADETTESDVDVQSADEVTESDVDTQTESDMEEATESDSTEQGNDEPTESDVDAQNEDEPTESDVDEEAEATDEPTESDAEDTSGD